MTVKLNNKTFFGATVMALLLLTIGATTINHLNTPAKVSAISLWQLPKDIERQGVPVTGKIKGLSPPPFGEHHHPQ